MKTRLILSSSLVAAVLSAVGMLAAFAQNATPRSTDAESGTERRAGDHRSGDAQPVILAAFADSSPSAQDPFDWLHSGPRSRGMQLAPAQSPSVAPRSAAEPAATQGSIAKAPEPESEVRRLPPVKAPARALVIQNPFGVAPEPAASKEQQPTLAAPPAETQASEVSPGGLPVVRTAPEVKKQQAVPWSDLPRDATPQVVNSEIVATPYVTDAVIHNPYFGGQARKDPVVAEYKPTAQSIASQPATERSSSVEERPQPPAPQEMVNRSALPWSAAPSQPVPDAVAMQQETPTAAPVEPLEPKVEQTSPRVTSEHQEPQLVAQRRARAVAAVVSRADELTRNGFRLAQRRAFYSARTEFIRALEVVAEALDADRDTNLHTRALAAGLRALEEVDDFLPRGTATGGEIQVARIAAGHQTPVLHDDADDVLPVRARQKYYSYAQQQLAESVGQVPAGSQALYGLGKLYGEIRNEPSPLIPDPGPKMMALQQAALMVDPQNWRAANELGVLLAKLQRLEEARGWLEHSVAVSKQQESWHNLQVVLAQLNEQQLAQHAGRQAAQLARTGRGEMAARVEWIKPQAFSRLPVDEPSVRRSAPSGQPSRTAEAPGGNDGGGFQWLPWK